MGVSLFWVLPEMGEVLHLPLAAACIGLGAGLLWLIDRYLYPVCPTCSAPHDHDHCSAELHGFAFPLLLASGIHAALDGWSAAAAAEGSAQLGPAFVFAIGVHKIPEGIALGVIVRAALRSRWQAIGWCALAEGATLAGAALETVMAPYVGPHALQALLAIAGGTFLYLGAHAIHAEWRRSGMVPAFAPAIAGAASPTVLRLLSMLR